MYNKIGAVAQKVGLKNLLQRDMHLVLSVFKRVKALTLTNMILHPLDQETPNFLSWLVLVNCEIEPDILTVCISKR